MKKPLAVLILLFALGVSAAHAAQVIWSGKPASPIEGVWLSPDWMLPGTHRYTEFEVRKIAHDTVSSLKKRGINTIFAETLFRGTSIANGSGPGVPMYDHLRWDFASRGTRTVDTLQIFIDEATAEGIQVHAWVHMFYWRMDNDNVYYSWQNVPSMWDDLLRNYLRDQAEAIAARRDPAQNPLVKTLRGVAASLQKGFDSREMGNILSANGYDSQGRPLSRLLHELLLANRPPPDFLLLGSVADPLPRHPGRTLRPLFLNPQHPVVQQRLQAAISAISQSHPDLAGVHLDHVRYPMDAQGIPTAWEPQGREPLYFETNNPTLAQRYRLYDGLINQRVQSLSALVGRIHTALYRGQVLSAAVLPLYYVERSAGVSRYNGYDYSAQDWYNWDIDFVVPMLYGFDPWKIRTLVRRYQTESATSREGSAGPGVVPGVSRLKMAQSGLLGNDDWVYFDLSLGLDMRLYKEQQEDYTWTPRKDL